MIYTKDDYSYVSGDISAVVIDGGILPYRVDDISAGLNYKKVLRGEDICYLAERALERYDVFADVGYERYTGTGIGIGWEQLWHTVESSGESFDFSKKVSSTQIKNLKTCYDKLLSSYNYGIWDYMSVKQNPVDVGWYAKMFGDDGQYFIKDTSQLYNGRDLTEVLDIEMPQLDTFVDVYNFDLSEYKLKVPISGNTLSLSSVQQFFDLSGFSLPQALAIRTAGTYQKDLYNLTDVQIWDEHYKPSQGNHELGYSVYGVISEDEQGHTIYKGCKAWYLPTSRPLMTVPSRKPFVDDDGTIRCKLYVVYQISRYQDDPDFFEDYESFTMMYEMSPEQLGDILMYGRASGFAPQGYTDLKSFLEDFAASKGWDIPTTQQDMIDKNLHTFFLNCVPTMLILVNNTALPTDYEIS